MVGGLLEGKARAPPGKARATDVSLFRESHWRACSRVERDTIYKYALEAITPAAIWCSDWRGCRVQADGPARRLVQGWEEEASRKVHLLMSCTIGWKVVPFTKMETMGKH